MATNAIVAASMVLVMVGISGGTLIRGTPDAAIVSRDLSPDGKIDPDAALAVRFGDMAHFAVKLGPFADQVENPRNLGRGHIADSAAIGDHPDLVAAVFR